MSIAIENETSATDAQADTKPKKAAKSKPAKKAKAQKKAKPVKKSDKPAADRTNKKAEVIAMMKRATGTTLAEIMEATGWQKHTVRGFVSILGKKGGEKIESSKNAAADGRTRSRSRLGSFLSRRFGFARGGVSACVLRHTHLQIEFLENARHDVATLGHGSRRKRQRSPFLSSPFKKGLCLSIPLTDGI